MKKKILLLMGVFSLGLLQAQVGVNVLNPQAMLDISSSGNTAATKALEINDASNTERLKVLDNGRVAIGVANPTIAVELREDSPVDYDNANSVFSIGNSAIGAAAAGAGALRYRTLGQVLSLTTMLNGTLQWIDLASTAEKAMVLAELPFAFPSVSFTSGAAYATVKNWSEVLDVTESFTPGSGIFVAPREGIYTVNVYMGFDQSDIKPEGKTANYQMSARWISKPANVADTPVIFESLTSYYRNALYYATVMCSGSFRLHQGDEIRVELKHNLGVVQTTRPNYSQISIYEN